MIIFLVEKKNLDLISQISCTKDNFCKINFQRLWIFSSKINFM